MSPSRELSVFTACVTKRVARALSFAAFPQFRLRRFAGRLLLAPLALLGLGTALSVHGQSAQFIGAQSTLYTLSGGSQARGVAVDAKGNVWVTQYGSSGVFEIEAVNGVIPASPTVVSVASGNFTYPGGLAFDAAGDLFVADVGDNAVKEIVAVSGSIPASPTVNTIGSGFSLPWALSFDSTGDLWVADSGNNSIKEIVAVSGSIPASPTIRVVGGTSTFSEPAGVWVDSLGNVFVSDTGHSLIKEMVGVAPPAASTPPASPTINTLGSGFSYPSSLAVDSSGNVWVSDYNNNLFKEIVAVGGSIPSSPAIYSIAAGSGVYGPIGVTIDAQGNVYYTAALGSVYELRRTLNFGTVPVGNASADVSLTAIFAVSGYSGSFTPTATAHYGKDYSLGAVSCTTTSYGENCSVTVTFQPTLPGGRKDALFVMNGTTRLASVLMGGVGQAPLALVQPGVITDINPSTSYYQYNSAVDENGTVYVVVTNGAPGSNVYSVTKTGVVSTVPVTVTGPWGIAVDGAGVLYIAQNTYSKVLVTYDTVTGTPGTLCVAPPAGGSSCTTSVNNDYLISVAVDQLGNVFATDIEYSPISVVELTPQGNYITTAISPAITQPYQLAVDSSDNIFVSGYTINEIPSGGTQSEINTAGASEGIAVDAAETIYATRYTGGGVAELPASGYGAAQANLDPTTAPLGLSLGSDGTLYVGNYGNLDKVDRSQGAIAFGSQNVNVASSQQTVGIYNGGNQNLTLSSFGISGAGFAMVPAGTNGCSTNLVIAPGQLCNVEVTATFPHAGTFSGSVTFTTNSLNTTSTTQTVNLSGYVYGPYLTTTQSAAFGNQNVGTQPTMTVTLTNNGYTYNAEPNVSLATVPTGFSVSSGTGAGSCGAASNSIAPGASCNVTVTFSPTSPVPYGGTISIPVASSGGGGPWPAVTFSASGTGVSPVPVAGLAPNPVTFTGQVAGTTSQAMAVTLSNTGGAALTSIIPSITGTNASDFAITTGTNACGSSLAAGSSCYIYVTFTPASAASFTATLSVADNASPSPQTATLNGTGVAFSSNVGTALAAQPVTVNITTAGTLNTIQVLTLGVPNQDFTATSGGTCTTTAYTVGQTCTVNVIFTPKYSGVRLGAVVLTNSSGVVLGTTYLPGTGVGPQMVFRNGTESIYMLPQVSTQFQSAIDASGNIFLAAGSDVIEIPAGCTTQSCYITIGGGNVASLGNLGGMAIDGSGNLFVTGSVGYVVELPHGCTSFSCDITLGGGWQNPISLAVDGNGNIYVADSYHNAIKEMPQGCLSSSCVTTLGGGFDVTQGVAVDGKGNVYVADNFNGAVKEMPKGCLSSACVTTLASSLPSPSGVAVDAAGDVYFTQAVPSEYGVYEMLAVNGSIPASPTIIHITPPTGTGTVSLDQAGNLYFSGSSSGLFKLDTVDPPSLNFPTPTNSGSLDTTDDPLTATAQNIGNASLSFSGIAPTTNFQMDAGTTCSTSTVLAEGTLCMVDVDFAPTAGGTLSGTVTLTDNNLNVSGATQPIQVSGTGIASVVPVAGLTPNPVTFTGQIAGTTSQAMAVTLSNTGGGALTGITASITGTNPSDFAIVTGTNACGSSLAAGASCYIYVTFTPASAASFTATLSVADNASPSPQTVTLNGTGVAFNSNVGTALAAQPVTVIITTAGTLNSIRVLTQGLPGLDFTETSGGTCATTTAYTVGQTCTVNVIFKPQVPGARPGAVLLTDASNDILGIAYLPGTGIGPQIAFSPGVQSTLPVYSGYSGPGYLEPWGVAVDAGLNVYVADGIYDWVIKIPWTGSAYGTPVQLPFNGLSSPEGVAVDGAGNVFVADFGNGRVVELPWNGSGYGTQIVLVSYGLAPPVPTGIAVDSHGNLFFVGIGHLTVPSVLIEIPWTGSGYGSPTTITTGLNGPYGVAVDANLNIYVADSGNNRVVEIPWNGTSFGAEIVVASGIENAGAVAVDGAGDVYIDNYYASTIVEVPWNGTAFGTPFTVPFTLGSGALANGIAVDGYGNLYASNFGYAAVDKLSVSTPPSLSFASTNVGSDTDPAQTVTVTNIGNASLTFSSGTNPNYPADFPENGSGTSLCATASPLTQGGSCNVSVNFKPTTTGPLGEDVVLTDNNLNVSGATQSIAVSGTGVTSSAPAINWGPLAAITYGTALGSGDFNATATSGSTNISADGTFSYTITSVGGAAATASTILPGGSDTLCVQWTPSSSFTSQYSSASECLPIQVNPASTSISWTPASPILYPATLGSGQFNASAMAGSTPVSSDGTFTYYVGPVSGGVVANSSTVLPVGSDQLCVQWTPSSTYVNDYSSSTGCANVSVNGSTTINWTPTTPITYGTALGSGDFNATATSGSTNISADGTFAYYVTSVGGTTATSSTILPGGSDQLCVQWTPLSAYTSQYDPASECLPIQVNPASTSISWTPASPILYPATLGSGQFNASASAGSTNVSADGTLVYYVGPVSGGVVANSSTVLPVGSDQLCVQWTPSSSYTADYNAASLCANVTVNAPTSISWTPASPITYGTALGSAQFNASASSGSTNISADGTFTYYATSVGGTVATGSTILPGGSDTLCVQWVPSSSYTSQYSSASLCSPIQVNPASTSISWSPSSTTIIASTGPTAGQLDALAMAGSTNVTADGTMTYHLSTAGGTLITTGTALTPGPVTICAVWAPSSTYALDYSGSNACQSFTVINTQPTTTTLAANANPIFSTNSVTFTVTVTPTSGTIVPTGTVTFLDGSTPIGTGTLSPSGTGASAIAKLTTSSLAIGSQSITASYPGDTNNQPSASAPLIELVEDFTITPSGSASGSVEPGLAATFTFTVSPVSPATTFPAAINLTPAGLPAGATYTLTPNPVASGAGSTTVTLTVITPITTLARNQFPVQGARWPLMAVALLLLPFAGKLRRAGRKLSRMLSIVLLLAAGLMTAAAVSGCGGTPSGYFGQAQTTSTITVTGTSGSLSHSATVSLTVE